MSDVEFCDTNVLLYDHDSTAPLEKRERAQSLFTALSASRRGCFSSQVLQEFCVNVVRVTHDSVRARDVASNISSGPSRSRKRRTSSVRWKKPSEADGRHRHTESVYADGVKSSE